jgi:hypothetical protein
MGLLAARKVFVCQRKIAGRTVAAFKCYLDGVPEAEIVPVRVAPWVFSISTANLA